MRRDTLKVAASTVILAYGGILGTLSIVVFLGMWLLKWKPAHMSWLLIIPAWALGSAAWSEYPLQSIYKAGEYASLVMCALIMANTVPVQIYMRGLVIGCSGVLLASLASGKYGVDPFSGNYSLVGLFGSKNMIGLFAEVLAFVSFASLFYEKAIVPRLFWCFLPFLLGIACLHLSKSASSVISLVATLAIVLVISLITKLPRQFRHLALAYTVMLLSGIILTGYTFDWHEDILRFFGKSTTLTGRTKLWDTGMDYGWLSPIMGHGYGAFWIQGFAPAEELWYRFGIGNRSGFHFHNLYIEAFVQMGVIGLVMVVMLLFTSLMKGTLLILRHGMNGSYVLGMGMALMFIVRSFVEVDALGTYGIGAFLIYAIIPMLRDKPAETRKYNPMKTTLRTARP